MPSPGTKDSQIACLKKQAGPRWPDAICQNALASDSRRPPFAPTQHTRIPRETSKLLMGEAATP